MLPEDIALTKAQAQQHNIATVDYFLNKNLESYANYDRDGNVLEIGYPTKRMSRHQYNYDKKSGALQEVAQYTKEDKLLQRVSYEYEKAMVVTRYYSIADGKERKLREIYENHRGEWIEKRSYDSSEKLKEKEKRTFGAHGLARWEKLTGERKPIKWIEYDFDDTTRMKHATLYTVVFPSDPPVKSGPFQWRQLDAEGRVEVEYENGYKQQSFTYDDLGNITQAVQWSKGKVERVQNVEYNGNNQIKSVVAKSGSDALVYRTVYTYDTNTSLLIAAETRYPEAGRVVKKYWQYTLHK